MIRFRLKPVFFTVTFALAANLAVFAGQNDVLPRNAAWKYLDNGVEPPSSWQLAGFDDSKWKTGAAPLGFGDAVSETNPDLPLATEVSFGNPEDKWITTWFRTSIDVPAKLLAVPEFEVYIHVDDGAVVYVNGKEAFRRGIPEGPVTVSTGAKFKPKEETFMVPSSVFTAGKNQIAVEVHQDDAQSSDLWFELGIRAPGGAEEASPVPVVKFPDSGAPMGAVVKLVMTVASDPSTARAFTWYTTLASERSDVQVVPKGKAKAADFAEAQSFGGRSAVSTNSSGEAWHKAEATGLTPSTEYWFRVGDEKLNLWSRTGSFTTAAAKGSFAFIDLADSQAKTVDEAALSAETFAKAVDTVKNASFMMINGDIVDTGMNERQWDWLFNASADTLLGTTLAPAAGNHEEDPESFIEHFNLPVPAGASTKTGAYYSFNWQGAHFIVLNNNEDSKEWADLTPAQVAWFENDVAAAKKNGASWIIAAMHKGPFTTSNHATDKDMTDGNGVRTKFAPLMEKLGVDLALQGHDHIYARTKPLMDNKASDRGTVFVIPGTAGPKVYYKNKKIDPSYYDVFAVADENHAAPYGPDPADASRPVRSRIQNFLEVKVEPKSIAVKTWEIDQSKNGAKPYVVDSFSIKK